MRLQARRARGGSPSIPLANPNVLDHGVLPLAPFIERLYNSGRRAPFKMKDALCSHPHFCKYWELPSRRRKVL
ncbi:hypothetical protein GCM10028796_32750 [Ramlibacter monticola]